MHANQAQLTDLLDGRKQFRIPIYQRTYSWENKQCQQLFNDVLRVGNNEEASHHFIGSVVSFTPNISPTTTVNELFVIDGQQRLTTVSLMLLALIHYLKDNKEISLKDDETWEGIQETYLINKHAKNESKFKLCLTQKDQPTYKNLIEGVDTSNTNSRILDSYNFFKERVSSENAQGIYHGIKKLMIVDIVLERGKDNPQRIFESLNSTGLGLSQADLIRNYILMDQSVELQESLYTKHWYPMEQIFGEKINSLASFIRDYLTMKESTIPERKFVYEAYKKFISGKNYSDALQELHKYSKHYACIALSQEQDVKLTQKLQEINRLKINTSYPFLLAVYDDFKSREIDKDSFIEVISLVLSYVFRGTICGVSTKNLSRTFVAIHQRVLHHRDQGNPYLESVKAVFLLMDWSHRFPSDEEFTEKLQITDVYRLKLRDYLLESLENWKRKEPVDAKNYTIEHILPQNQNTPSPWKKELGKNWEEVKAKYLHTLGNLSLTGYNPELSDRPFSEKKEIEGGFNTSPLFLNESVREVDTWNEEAICARAFKLAERACDIWRKPNLSNKILERYRGLD